MKAYLSAVLPQIGVTIPGGPAITQGKAFFLNPYYGVGDGAQPKRGLTSLTVAKAKMTDYKNDVCYFLSAHDTAAYTTDYQSTTMDWSKHMCHIIGVGSGSIFSQRSRVAFAAAYNTASNLFTVSGNDNQFHNLQFFEGVAGTNPTGCVNITGNRNYFKRCHMAGIGADTNDIASAYSLRLAGAENVFEECVIGLDTIDRGTAANSEIAIAAGAVRNVFRKCIILMRLQHATNSPFVRVAGGAMGNPGITALFDDCMFIHSSTNYVYAQDVGIVVTATPTAGIIVIRNSTTTATAWVAAGNKVYVHNSVSNTGYNQGISYAS